MDWLAGYFEDLRHGFRSLRKSPGLATATILILALGIGSNTAIFSVLEGVVLAPLPFAEPDRLVAVALLNRSLGYATNLSYPDFLDWQHDSHSFDRMAAFVGEGFDLTSPGAPEHVSGKQVSSSFFDTLGIRPSIGRNLSPEEDTPGARPVVVISHRLWQDRFGGSLGAVGKVLTLNGVNHTIVGVLPAKFRFDDPQADVYTAIARRNPIYMRDRTVHDILCIGRLRNTLDVDQALAEMNVVQNHIDELNPATERGQGVYIVPLKKFLVGDIGVTLSLLFGAVGFVLLIAIANVTNLLLARSTGRTREFAIRLSLGASRAHIIRLLLAESLQFSLIGGLLGLILAKWTVRVALAAELANVPRVDNIHVNTTILLFTFGISLIAGVACGLFPGLKMTKTGFQTGLAAGGRGLTGGHQHIQNALAVLQIALALVLLTGGSLLFRTMRNLWTVNPGFNPHGIITFQVGLSSAAASTPTKVRVAYRALVERIRRIPGIEAADMTALVPLGHAFNEGPFWTGTHQSASMAEIPRAIYYPVGPDYITTMQIPLLRGRLLSAADDSRSPLVILIDSLMARRFFPEQNPVDRTITIPHWGEARNVPARIVGVVGHVEHYGLDGSMGEKPQIYYSFYQLPDEAVPVFRDEVAFAVRTPLPVESVMPAITNSVREAGSGQPVYNIRTMQNLVSGSMARQRFPMLLLAAFAVLALLLALVGIHGVISYSAACRVNEMGIRLALGAVNRDVLRLVLHQGLRLAPIGIAIGATASLILSKAVLPFSTLLYGVRPGDPVTLTVVSVLVMLATAVACYIPARRAANLDPTIALRRQ